MADLDKLSEEHGALKAQVASLRDRTDRLEERLLDTRTEMAELRGARKSLIMLAGFISGLVAIVAEIVRREWGRL